MTRKSEIDTWYYTTTAYYRFYRDGWRGTIAWTFIKLAPRWSKIMCHQRRLFQPRRNLIDCMHRSVFFTLLTTIRYTQIDMLYWTCRHNDESKGDWRTPLTQLSSLPTSDRSFNMTYLLLWATSLNSNKDTTWPFLSVRWNGHRQTRTHKHTHTGQSDSQPTAS